MSNVEVCNGPDSDVTIRRHPSGSGNFLISPKWGISTLRLISENPQIRRLGQLLQLAGFVNIFITIQMDMEFFATEAAGRSPEWFLVQLMPPRSEYPARFAAYITLFDRAV